MTIGRYYGPGDEATWPRLAFEAWRGDPTPSRLDRLMDRIDEDYAEWARDLVVEMVYDALQDNASELAYAAYQRDPRMVHGIMLYAFDRAVEAIEKRLEEMDAY